MSGKEIEALHVGYIDAYNRWRDAIKEKLSDGMERECYIEAMLDDGCDEPTQCEIDKIKCIGNDIMIHLISRDYDDCDEWTDIYDLETSSFDSVLNVIVWED